MSSFNTYHWHEFKVSKREQVPAEPHYQALVFGTRSEWSPPYDRHDDPSGSSSSVPNVDLYVFKQRKDLELFVDEAARTGASFVFYHVGSLGKATVHVEVKTEVEGHSTSPMHYMGDKDR
jgi:hypothetical protein